MNYPLISVVMPAYNVERYIEKSINSILDQSYPNVEILVADDASTDKTKAIIDGYTDARIKRFHNESNQAYLKTCNKLMSLAKGQFLAFQDADDFSHVQRFEGSVFRVY